MIIDETKTSGVSAFTQKVSPSTGLIADVLPEVQKPVLAKKSQTGVSTRNGLFDKSKSLSQPTSDSKNSMPSQESSKLWYALRTTYGREKKAYTYLISKGITAYYPTIMVDKLIDGRIKSVEVSRIPNMFFAYGTEKEIKRFVYDNVNLPFLRFYYRYYNPQTSSSSVAAKSNISKGLAKEPLIVPDRQIETLKIICEAEGQDTIITTEPIHKFEKGNLVRVTNGPFAGAVGVVARFKGQQRVGIQINGIVTAITAYIPSAFIKRIK